MGSWFNDCLARALSAVAVRTRSSRGEGSRVGFLDRRIARSVMLGLSGELGWSST
jgi:hypothetical protein